MNALYWRLRKKSAYQQKCEINSSEQKISTNRIVLIIIIQTNIECDINCLGEFIQPQFHIHNKMTTSSCLLLWWDEMWYDMMSAWEFILGFIPIVLWFLCYGFTVKRKKENEWDNWKRVIEQLLLLTYKKENFVYNFKSFYILQLVQYDEWSGL